MYTSYEPMAVTYIFALAMDLPARVVNRVLNMVREPWLGSAYPTRTFRVSFLTVIEEPSLLTVTPGRFLKMAYVAPLAGPNTTLLSGLLRPLFRILKFANSTSSPGREANPTEFRFG